jgi:hypothetical protein
MNEQHKPDWNYANYCLNEGFMFIEKHIKNLNELMKVFPNQTEDIQKVKSYLGNRNLELANAYDKIMS